MFQNRSEYDRGVNTFSPEGRLFQVEYAIEAIKALDGVVLAVEKRLTSSLIVPESVEKVFEIDTHIGCAVSGLTADARMLVEHARVESQHHRFTFNEPIKTESLTQIVCDLALRFGEDGSRNSSIMSRPFGVALLIAGVDESGPQLFFADPSGTFTQYSAKAIGSASEIAQGQLQEDYRKDLSVDEAILLAAKILKQVMEDKMNSVNAQLAVVTRSEGYRVLSESSLNEILSKLA